METKRVREKTVEEYKSLKSCQLIWELVKINVKDYTICYCKNKAQDRTRATRSIQKDLDIVNENILNLEVKEHISNEEIIKLNNLKVKKLELESKQQPYYNLKQQGQYVRDSDRTFGTVIMILSDLEIILKIFITLVCHICYTIRLLDQCHL